MTEFMFQNVAFRATVYRTGEVGFTQFIFMYIQHDSVTTGIIPKKWILMGFSIKIVNGRI